MLKEIRQEGENLICYPDNVLHHRYSENISIPILLDKTYANYSLKWSALSPNNRKHRIPIAYDDESKNITLNKDCFKDNRLFIACAFIRENVIITSSLVDICIPVSINHGLGTVPQTPGLYEEMRELFQQIFDNEYRKPMDDLIHAGNETIKAVEDLSREFTENELDRIRQESLRQAADSNRENKEQTRQTNETTRASHETARENAERARNTNESTRMNAEQARNNTFKVITDQFDTKMDDLKNKLDNGAFNGPQGKQGKSIRVKGAWTSGVAYVDNTDYIDIVTYNGSTYGCIMSHSSTSSITPDNARYWTLLVEKGEQGIQGPSGPAERVMLQANNFKQETASPKEYPSGLTLFYSTISFNGITKCIVKTVVNAAFAFQYVFGENTIYSRTSSNGTAWSEWQKDISSYTAEPFHLLTFMDCTRKQDYFNAFTESMYNANCLVLRGNKNQSGTSSQSTSIGISMLQSFGIGKYKLHIRLSNGAAFANAMSGTDLGVTYSTGASSTLPCSFKREASNHCIYTFEVKENKEINAIDVMRNGFYNDVINIQSGKEYVRIWLEQLTDSNNGVTYIELKNGQQSVRPITDSYAVLRPDGMSVEEALSIIVSQNETKIANNFTTTDKTYALGADQGRKLYQNALKIGHIVMGTKLYDGWLECNGQAVYRSTYSALYAVIGTIHGTGNGSTTFNVPNIKPPLDYEVTGSMVQLKSPVNVKYYIKAKEVE